VPTERDGDFGRHRERKDHAERADDERRGRAQCLVQFAGHMQALDHPPDQVRQHQPAEQCAERGDQVELGRVREIADRDAQRRHRPGLSGKGIEVIVEPARPKHDEGEQQAGDRGGAEQRGCERVELCQQHDYS